MLLIPEPSKRISLEFQCFNTMSLFNNSSFDNPVGYVFADHDYYVLNNNVSLDDVTNDHWSDVDTE